MHAECTAMNPDSFNATNRGVYISDNLQFLRSLNDECIDLVCIDPPFAKNETFEADRLRPPLTDDEMQNELRLMSEWGINSANDARRADIAWPATRNGGYKDIWSWEDDIHEVWLTDLDMHYPATAQLIESTRYSHSESIAAYLCYMAVRLFELHRVLKPSGNLFLHCDHTANGYIRQLLDTIFGRENFRNEIVWCYTGPSNTPRWFPRKHDTIFFYGKTHNTTFNRDAVRIEYQKLDTGKTSGIFKAAATLDEAGKVPEDYWLEGRDGMSPVGRLAHERTGYPTQKPISLARRIIEAGSNEGDVVLDCFAGCAYTALAAEMTGRRWVACDLNPRAWTVFKRQFVKPELVKLRCSDTPAAGQMVNDSEPVVTVHGPNDLPIRTSPEREVQIAEFKLPERKFRVPASMIPEAEMLAKLLDMSGYVAWCCGFANRKPDGTVMREPWNFHLDHINPRSKPGTSNEITNRAPLCPYHNTKKGNRRIHLAEYRLEIAVNGEMMVPIDELIDLDEAYHKALALHVEAAAVANS